MKFFELDDPHVDVVMFLNENKHEPKMALVDASLHFGLPTEEILAIYRRHLKETIVNELFDNPVPTELTRRFMPEDPLYTYTFKTDSNQYKIAIDHDTDNSGNWLVSFYALKDDKASGEPTWVADQTNDNKDQIKVLSTVINVLKTLFSKNPIKPGSSIEFYAQGDSRVNLYKRLCQKLATNFGLTLNTERKKSSKFKYSDVIHFMLTKPVTEDITIRNKLSETTIPKTKKSFDFLSLTKKAKAKLKTHNAYKTIDAKELIDNNRLKGTQDKPSDPSVGEEAFSTLSHPVIVEVNGVGYILDGHGRIAKSIKKETPIKVHWVKIS